MVREIEKALDRIARIFIGLVVSTILLAIAVAWLL